MKSSKWFLVMFLIYFLGFITHAAFLKKTIYGDGVFYYAWARSIIIDHDINFRNDYALFGVSQPTTQSGLPGNKYSVGPAMLWATDTLWTHILKKGDGTEFPYHFFIGLDSVLAALCGLALLFRLLTTFFSPSISLFTTLSIAFATNLLFYGSLDTVNSHAASFFAAIIFLNLLLTKHRKRSFLIGLSLGVVGLMRTQDLVYAFLLLPYRRELKLQKVFAGFLIGFLPQLVAWQALYGTFLSNPYLNSYEGFNLFRPHILQVLFSPKNGLFFWTPILLIGLVGLFLVKEINRWLLFVVLAQILVVSSWSTWWQGASYSGRMFVSTLPLFAFGLAHIFTRLWQKGWRQFQFLFVLIGPLSILNMLLIVYFLLIT